MPKLVTLIDVLWRGRQGAAPPWRRTAPAAGTPDDDDRPRGCGWFDSSHQLQVGLLVQEPANAQALGTELPLEHWLVLHLSSRGVTSPK